MVEEIEKGEKSMAKYPEHVDVGFRLELMWKC